MWLEGSEEAVQWEARSMRSGVWVGGSGEGSQGGG